MILNVPHSVLLHMVFSELSISVFGQFGKDLRAMVDNSLL